MLRALVIVALVLTAASATGAPMNVGHRGYSAATPENTLTAERRAFEVGADMVELDVQKSSDGHVVVIHDDTVGRTTDSLTDDRVDSLDLGELRALDAGYPDRFGSEFAGERIPTLEEILEEAKGRGPLLLDQKSSLLFGSGIAAALASAAFPLDQVWVTAWNGAQVADIQLHVPSARILWTQGAPSIWEATMDDFLDQMEALGVDGISVVFENYTFSAPGLAAATQARGLLAFAWNFEEIPDTAEKMQTAVEIGLDGYIVNDPETFANIITEPTVTATPTVPPKPTPTPAPPAQLDETQQTCVNQMNKNGEKVNKAQLKDAQKCLKDYQKGRLATSFEACTGTDREGKVEKAQDKTLVGEAKRCDKLTVPPPFAYTNTEIVNQHAVGGGRALSYAIFGGPPVLDADLATEGSDKDTARCQLQMLKQASKAENALLKEINKVKKNAIKNAAIDHAAALEAELERAFSTEKITKATGALAQKVGRKCDGLGLPDTIFPGACANAILGNVSDCVIAAAHCQACLQINAMDNLDLDCDGLDDGDTGNGSCP